MRLRRGAEGMGGKLAAEAIALALRYAARLIRWIGGKVFGKGAGAIAEDVAEAANARDPYGSDPESGGKTGDES
ncbi:hypothetical protein [Dactylosporangium salmoneum]|uniref:Uncharacterized protein n=1 Tax=Dactylosporangium salmoneum TaxID=53361 RepID=A0ABP5SIS5_9ACTN